jgi:cupin 2 domain-containing protein
MEPRFLTGRLDEASSAPVEGERFIELVRLSGAMVEQILSGRLSEPASFDQDHDEWVLVLEGRAKLVVDGAELELRSGDWLFLPAGCSHTVVETQAGTSWLALHARSV